MQVTLNPSSAAEVRLLAAFMQDYADLIELQQGAIFTEKSQPVVAEVQEKVAAAPIVIEDKPAPKKQRKSKEAQPGETQSAGTAETPAESGASETAEVAPVEAGNDPAQAVSEPAASSEATGASPSASPVAEPGTKVTHDDLRKLLGELTQNGKRDAAIAAVRAIGFNSISAISEDKLAEVATALKAL